MGNGLVGIWQELTLLALLDTTDDMIIILKKSGTNHPMIQHYIKSSEVQICILNTFFHGF